MAERGGFEPPIRFNPYNGLANRRLQPLGHLSTSTVTRATLPEYRGSGPGQLFCRSLEKDQEETEEIEKPKIEA